jgi:methylated-DNA-protein-cysteine methyltransferase related protein
MAFEDVALTPFQRAVIDVLEATQPGDVLSYGDVAAEAGYPGAARAVGNILAHSDGLLPWWRVVTASGRLIPHDPLEQARRLAAEGVTCRNGRVVAGAVETLCVERQR